MKMTNNRETVITSIVFQSEVIMIGYFMRGDQVEDGGLEHILTVSTDGYEALIEEIQLAVAEDIVEDFLQKRRGPPESLPATSSRLSRSKDVSPGDM